MKSAKSNTEQQTRTPAARMAAAKKTGRGAGHSTSTQILYPVLRYTDVHAAVEWLERVLDFKRIFAGESFAMMRLHGAAIMLSSDPAPDLKLESPRVLGGSTAAIHVHVADVDAHHDRTAAAGAEIVSPLQNTPHGSRDYNLRDLEGHIWAFSTYGP
jgi:uncharacterized glyoxalase superfamily protein PhnB